MKKDTISELRKSARKLIRELGVLRLNTSQTNRAPQHWHTLIEISNQPDITMSKLGRLLLLTNSNMSRIVRVLMNDKLITLNDGPDKREKYLTITPKGLLELKNIDDFSHRRINGALEFLSEQDQEDIILALNKYANALEVSRLLREQIKIHKLSTARNIRKQIIHMIESIQKDEFHLPITTAINDCILRAEETFYFNHAYNFWYAVDHHGTIIGSIGLKKIDKANAEIKKFFVAEKFRGKGVAQKLLQSLLKAAHKHRFKSLYLGTVSSLQAAQRFYDKSGFSRIKQSDLPVSFQKCPLDTVFFKADLKNIKDDAGEELE